MDVQQHLRLMIVARATLTQQALVDSQALDATYLQMKPAMMGAQRVLLSLIYSMKELLGSPNGGLYRKMMLMMTAVACKA